MALELTVAVLRYLESVALNRDAVTPDTPPLPESAFIAATAEATAFSTETNLSAENASAVNAASATARSLLSEIEATPGYKAADPVVLASTTPSNKRALPVTLSVLGTAWQQLQLPEAERTMTPDLVRAAETETAYAAAGILPPPAHADTVNNAAMAVEGTPIPAPSATPRATTNRIITADHVSALVEAHRVMANILKAIGINVKVENAD